MNRTWFRGQSLSQLQEISRYITLDGAMYVGMFIVSINRYTTYNGEGRTQTISTGYSFTKGRRVGIVTQDK